MEILYREKQLARSQPVARRHSGALVPSHRHYVPTRVSLYVLATTPRWWRPTTCRIHTKTCCTQVAGQARTGGGRRGLVRRRGEGDGREKGLDYFQKLAASAPAHTQRPYASRGAGRIRRDPDGARRPRPGGGAAEEARRAGGMEAAPARLRAAELGRPLARARRTRMPLCSSPTSSFPRKARRSSRRASACPRAARSTARSTTSTTRWSIR
jgi:hypothetical protein